MSLKVWPIVCGLLVIGVAYYRTRSCFFIFHQLLKILALEGRYSNPDDQRVADEYLDLNKFNLKTGFRLDSVKAKTRLHAWMIHNDIEYAELKRARWYFDANKLTFKLLGVKRRLISAGCPLLLAGALFATAQSIHSEDHALFRVDETGTWFWAGNNEAFSSRYNAWNIFRGKPWIIHQHHCRYIEGASPVEDIWDKDVICDFVLGFSDKEIGQAILQQNSAARVIAFLGLAPLILFIFLVNQQRAAVALNARVLSPPP